VWQVSADVDNGVAAGAVEPDLLDAVTFGTTRGNLKVSVLRKQLGKSRNNL
jgi:hypothetical protein